MKKDQSKAAKVLSSLAKSGPVFPAMFTMSDFRVEGLVKGDWPVFIEYELESDSTAVVTVNTTTNGELLSFTIPLPSTNGGRGKVKKYLPGTFGQKPQAGFITFQAFKNGPEKRPADFFLSVFGFGPNAVRSRVIVGMRTGPPKIRVDLKEKISYSFQSLSDFNKVAAEFRLVKRDADGSSYQPVVHSKIQDGVRREQMVENDWNGKDSKGKVSVGLHLFVVRAWRGLKEGADYTYSADRPSTIVDKE